MGARTGYSMISVSELDLEIYAQFLSAFWYYVLKFVMGICVFVLHFTFCGAVGNLSLICLFKIRLVLAPK